jgi:hypothetical protein
MDSPQLDAALARALESDRAGVISISNSVSLSNTEVRGHDSERISFSEDRIDPDGDLELKITCGNYEITFLVDSRTVASSSAVLADLISHPGSAEKQRTGANSFVARNRRIQYDLQTDAFHWSLPRLSVLFHANHGQLDRIEATNPLDSRHLCPRLCLIIIATDKLGMFSTMRKFITEWFSGIHFHFQVTNCGVHISHLRMAWEYGSLYHFNETVHNLAWHVTLTDGKLTHGDGYNKMTLDDHESIMSLGLHSTLDWFADAHSIIGNDSVSDCNPSTEMVAARRLTLLRSVQSYVQGRIDRLLEPSRAAGAHETSKKRFCEGKNLCNKDEQCDAMQLGLLMRALKKEGINYASISVSTTSAAELRLAMKRAHDTIDSAKETTLFPLHPECNPLHTADKVFQDIYDSPLRDSNLSKAEYEHFIRRSKQLGVPGPFT